MSHFLFPQGLLLCVVHQRKCLSHLCDIRINYQGEEDSIFFLTRTLGCAEEVIWDFVNAVSNLRIHTSFSQFCRMKTRDYQSLSLKSAPFMSYKSFVPLFFCWVVCLRIDFRAEVDPSCGHNPSMLACDGTHIGVSVKTLNLKSAITKPELEETVKVDHKKMNRCLLPHPPKKRLMKPGLHLMSNARRLTEGKSC